jgi:hypothetical protein
MSDEDPKDTDSVADTREEDVLPAGLIVGQATSDALNVTQVTSTANEVKNQPTSDFLDVTHATSAANEVKNQPTSENLDADTREDMVPAGFLVAQATSDDLDATEALSTVNEVKI